VIDVGGSMFGIFKILNRIPSRRTDKNWKNTHNIRSSMRKKTWHLRKNCHFF